MEIHIIVYVCIIIIMYINYNLYDNLYIFLKQNLFRSTNMNLFFYWYLRKSISTYRTEKCTDLPGDDTQF